MIEEKKLEPIKILLVEDNPGDALLTKEAFEESRLKVDLEIVENGEDALDLLKDSAKVNPDLILLDINLPGISGLGVLTEIKDDIQLRRIPIVMLTTSNAEVDILQAYDHYANCYITKPVQFDDFAEVLKTLEDFWFTVVKLPTASNEKQI